MGDAAGQLAGALSGLAMAPLSGLAALGGGLAGGVGGGAAAPWQRSGGALASMDMEDSKTREALRFVFSPEGAFFREFLMDVSWRCF